MHILKQVIKYQIGWCAPFSKMHPPILPGKLSTAPALLGWAIIKGESLGWESPGGSLLTKFHLRHSFATYSVLPIIRTVRSSK